MGGHIHLPYTLALPEWGRVLWVVQAGTAVSSRTRPDVPNSVNILRWGDTPGGQDQPSQGRQGTGRSCRIEQWDFAYEAQAFLCAGVTEVQPERTTAQG